MALSVWAGVRLDLTDCLRSSHTIPHGCTCARHAARASRPCRGLVGVLIVHHEREATRRSRALMWRCSCSGVHQGETAADASRTRPGRVLDASRTIEFEEMDASRTRPQPFLPDTRWEADGTLLTSA
eukprot:gene22548-biopygen1183